MSSPLLALTRSLPPNASITSFSFVPFILSSPSVPTMVAGVSSQSSDCSQRLVSELRDVPAGQLGSATQIFSDSSRIKPSGHSPGIGSAVQSFRKLLTV